MKLLSFFEAEYRYCFECEDRGNENTCEWKRHFPEEFDLALEREWVKNAGLYCAKVTPAGVNFYKQLNGDFS